MWAALVGHWNSGLQYRRVIFSVLQATYRFVQDAPLHKCVRAPPAVRAELLLLVFLIGDMCMQS